MEEYLMEPRILDGTSLAKETEYDLIERVNRVVENTGTVPSRGYRSGTRCITVFGVYAGAGRRRPDDDCEPDLSNRRVGGVEGRHLVNQIPFLHRVSRFPLLSQDCVEVFITPGVP